MSAHLKFVVITLLFSSFLACPVWAEPTRAIRVALTGQYLHSDPFPHQVSPLGTGVYSAYEFILKPSFIIGINLSYRFFPGNQQMHQMGYGLLLKHYLPQTFYLSYGLLMNVSYLSGVRGSGTSHDTKLSGGVDFSLGKLPLFFEVAWHYSSLRFFNTVAIPLHYFEIGLGTFLSW